MVATPCTFSGHWLTFVTRREPDEVLEVLGGHHGEWQALRAYGQPGRVVHESGASVHFGSKNEEQPTVVVLSGSVCEGWWKEGLEWADKLGGRVTRVDAACDVEPAEAARSRLIEMAEAFTQGKCKTKMRSTSHHIIRSERPGDGWTAYFGGQQSQLQMRVYDRRGPLRIEHQFRPGQDMGQEIPERVLKRGVERLWRTLAHYCVWPMTWYQALLTGDGLEIRQDEEEETQLMHALMALRDQHGGNLWALSLLGFTLEDLTKDYGDVIRGDIGAKYMRWAEEAKALGYDGKKLKQEVRCRLKSARK